MFKITASKIAGKGWVVMCRCFSSPRQVNAYVEEHHNGTQVAWHVAGRWLTRYWIRNWKEDDMYRHLGVGTYISEIDAILRRISTKDRLLADLRG